MSSNTTLQDLVITWFPIVQAPRGREHLEAPIVQEVLPHRRAWTAARDLVAASTEHEQWRPPTACETLTWELDQPKENDLGGYTRWLVATTGEPGLGVPTSMAVRLQEAAR